MDIFREDHARRTTALLCTLGRTEKIVISIWKGIAEKEQIAISTIRQDNHKKSPP